MPPEVEAVPEGTSIEGWSEKYSSQHLDSKADVPPADISEGSAHSPGNVLNAHPGADNSKTEPFDIFRRQLLGNGCGLPLWDPGSSTTLPVEYRKKGTSVGDVGFITPEGAFVALFSVFDSDNPCEEYPPVTEKYIQPVQTLQSDFVASPTITGPKHDPSLAEFSFVISPGEGAIMFYPDGASVEDLTDIHQVRMYAAQNIERWYQYANGQRGLRLNNGDLRLVTGCHKASSWCMVALSTEQGGTLEIKMSRPDNESLPIVECEQSGLEMLYISTRPDSEDIKETRFQENQCLYVRTLNLMLGEERWAALSSYAPEESEPGTGSAPAWAPGTSNLSVHHPSNDLNRALRNIVPSAKLVASCDADWTLLLQQGVDLASEDVYDSITAIWDLFDEEGMVYLELRQHEETASTSSADSSSSPRKRKRESASQDSKEPASKKATVPSHTQIQSAGYSDSVMVSPDKGTCKDGHYTFVPGATLHNRYKTIRLVGQGTFSKVVECLDVDTNTKVAVKIIRAVKKYREASKIEIRALQKLKECDPENINKCIHLLNWFEHQQHVCLVTELLGMSIHDFLKSNDCLPFPRHHVQKLARQLLESVAFLHDLSLVHTDMKPQNILLTCNDYQTIRVADNGTVLSPAVIASSGVTLPPMRYKRILKSTDIRLIDFGSATFAAEHHSTVITTRLYRAPEIILGLGWSLPCDVYSLGCILVEFFTGDILFKANEDIEHLAMMEIVLGSMTVSFAYAAAAAKPDYFKRDGSLYWPKPTVARERRMVVKSARPLYDIIQPTDEINIAFLDLTQKLLTLDPAYRISVREALQHPYFSLNIPPEF